MQVFFTRNMLWNQRRGWVVRLDKISSNAFLNIRVTHYTKLNMFSVLETCFFYKPCPHIAENVYATECEVSYNCTSYIITKASMPLSQVYLEQSRRVKLLTLSLVIAAFETEI